MANDQRHQIVRRFLVWIGLLRVEEARSEAKSVLAEAREELAASRIARRHEMAVRVKVIGRSGR